MQPTLIAELQTTNQPTQPIYYPESDGEPMAETDYHLSVLFYLIGALRFLFHHVPDVYVAGNMMFYYVEGNPAISKAPDVFVVKGVGKHKRRVWKTWEERAVPSVIFEITSPSTSQADLHDKKQLYERLGVQEYYLFDPLSEYLKPRFQGFRLVNGRYEPLRPERDRSIISLELGVILRPEGELLRVIDPATSQVMPTLDEAVERIDETLDQLDYETERAEQEAQRAEQEAQRANRAEAELARALAELAELKRHRPEPGPKQTEE